jgi:GNAT superfamily N-acetyltransferase
MEPKRNGMKVIEPEKKLSLLPLRPQRVGEISRTICSLDPWLSMQYRPEALEHYLLRADPALSRYSVMVSENLAGVLALRYPWLFGPFIELMALFDGFRGKGIGGLIIDWVCLQYKETNVWVTASAGNTGAQRFYESKGFERTAVLDNLIKPGWNEILLRKRTGRGRATAVALPFFL